MKISYAADLRAKAKEQKRNLFTIAIESAGLKCQGMSDKQLDHDLLQALVAYRERCKAAKKPEAAR